MPAKKSSTGAKIVDVAHPDSVKTDATSVPVIVKNRPILKDPMVAAEEPAKKTDEKKEEDSPVVTHVELKPVSADGAKTEKSDPEKLTGDVKPIELPAEQEPADKPTEETKPAPDAEPEKPAESGDDKKAPEEDQELLPGAEPTDPAAAKAAREAAEKQLALDKLAAEGTYFLPINAVEKRKIRTALVILLVVIILGAVGFLAAMDAGYVHINDFDAPTNFIKN